MNKKRILLILLPLLAVVLVSATLLTYYGKITGIVTVEQSVLVDGEVSGVDLTDNGEIHTLQNNAGVIAPIEFKTTYLKDGSWDGGVGITTTYIGVLNLTKKDTSWQPIGDQIEITYTLVGDTFEFSGVPDGYTLIYYKDEVVGLEGRLANPQPAITVTGGIGSLPHSNDANIDELADYCGEPDNYAHCKGAKLWAVPTSDIVGSNLNWANMANYYYETDLMAYSANEDGEITLPANGGGVNFKIVNDFNVALIPGVYTITTKIVPTE